MNIFTNPDILFEIITRMHPKELLHFYLINKQFYDVHKKESIYPILIKKYYPNSYLTPNPKKQFTALANNMSTNYFIKFNPDVETCVQDNNGRFWEMFVIMTDNIYLCKNTKNYDNEPVNKFEIKGLQPNDGDVYWILTAIHAYHENTEAFLTLEDAINNLIDNYYVNIISTALYDYFGKYNIDNPYTDTDISRYVQSNLNFFDQIINTSEFKSFLLERIPIDCLSKKNFFDYCMQNKFFFKGSNDPDGLVSWQFTKISISNVPYVF